VISLSGVSKWYASSAKVLDQLNLHLNKGDFLYIVGGTGAGKSTLLRLLATEELPAAGTIQLFGYDIAQISPNTLRAIRQVIGYIPQDLRLIPDLSVYDNVALSLSLVGRRSLHQDAKRRILDTLEKLGLAAKRDSACGLLSGGEAQRVAVARALVREPELIIADEPTGAQDPDSLWSMMDLFVKANQQGVTVVLATHDRQIVRRVKKPCASLKGGRVHLEDNLCMF
jgi:cell division transport system ATP-binding protein